jgi:hypothetical protein
VRPHPSACDCAPAGDATWGLLFLKYCSVTEKSGRGLAFTGTFYPGLRLWMTSSSSATSSYSRLYYANFGS